MAELIVKENETTEVVVNKTPKPTVLSADQIETFSDLIKINTPYLQDQIKDLKTSYPTEFGDIEPLTENEISDFTDTATEALQEKLSLYESIALPDVPQYLLLQGLQ